MSDNNEGKRKEDVYECIYDSVAAFAYEQYGESEYNANYCLSELSELISRNLITVGKIKIRRETNSE